MTLKAVTLRATSYGRVTVSGSTALAAAAVNGCMIQRTANTKAQLSTPRRGRA